MNEKSIIIIGAIRNGEKYIKQVLNNIIKIGNLFKNYKVIIYENDSIDATKNILNKYKKNNIEFIFEKDNIEFIFENNNIEFIFEKNIDKLYQFRTQRLAYIRNKLLKYVLEKYTNYDYLLNMDLDDINSTNDIFTTFHYIFDYNEEIWDVQTIHQRKEYYDIWAYRKAGLIEYDCWLEVRKDESNKIPYNDSYNNHIAKYKTPYTLKRGLIPVISAFGGAAIYKMCKLVEAKDDGLYVGLNEYGEVCEHVYFHEVLKNKYNSKIFINPLWINKD